MESDIRWETKLGGSDEFSGILLKVECLK